MTKTTEIEFSLKKTISFKATLLNKDNNCTVPVIKDDLESLKGTLNRAYLNKDYWQLVKIEKVETNELI